MQRQAIIVEGVVQGVGFRPFVYALASRLRLSGYVGNRSGSVAIEVEGERASLDRFLEELLRSPPPLSRIDDIRRRVLPALHDAGFRIEPSSCNPTGQVFVSPDVATCDDCLAELFDPADRRSRYPFLNCTNCGPRLTIVRGAPYDRERTTMASFPMCQGCREEYEDPANRRFHAQPIACPACGPRLEVIEASGQRIATDDPLAVFADAVLTGRIGALKGLGGFHLVCDARNEHAVGELRRRKHRDEKPLAIMVPHLEAARRLCEADAREEELLESRRRPIVLLRKRTKASGVCEAVAPGNPCLGAMLPYTPLHHLLMEAVGDVPLVMTSGNRSDEPIAYLDDDALERLGGIADVFLTSDRPIYVRCDDSVTRIVAGEEAPVRRSRGYAPQPVALPLECRQPTLAVGGQLKGTFALGRGRRAFLSHHLGDLDHLAAYRAFERDIGLYERLFDVRPTRIVHDLHPDYASTGYAQRRGADEGIESLAVQHHHAHLASCLAENGLDEPAIGVIFDGTGYGTDGTIWGGEFLVGDYAGFSRAAHLRRVPMPGGLRAIAEPWRMAVAHLLDAQCDLGCLQDIPVGQRRTVEQMIARGFNSPLTSSAGRLFDAVAAIAGLRSRMAYEGQAAIELEWRATDVAEDRTYPFELSDGEIDTRPLIRAVVEDAGHRESVATIARRFHCTVVEIVAAVCGRIRQQSGLEVVALSGGVFMNALLTREVAPRLASDGFRVHRHRLVPANDGGLCLGQLAIAARTQSRCSLREQSVSSRSEPCH